MTKIVLDTNILISAALTEEGNSSKIINMVLNGELAVFFSEDIMKEYTDVFSRPKFRALTDLSNVFINGFKVVGNIIEPERSNIHLPDESDRIFYDAAKCAGALLITGNTKHFPSESFILHPAVFLKSIDPAI